MQQLHFELLRIKYWHQFIENDEFLATLQQFVNSLVTGEIDVLDNNNNKPTTKYESLEDLNLITLWSQSGSDWSSTIKEEIQADTKQAIAEEESNTTSKVVLFGVLATLTLLVATMCTQATKIYQSVQEVGTNSFKELISKD